MATFNVYDRIQHAHTGKHYSVESVPSDHAYLYDGRKFYTIIDFNGAEAQWYTIPQSEVEDGTFMLVEQCKYCGQVGIAIVVVITVTISLLLTYLIRYFQ